MYGQGASHEPSAAPPPTAEEQMRALRPSPRRLALTVVLLGLGWGGTMLVHQQIAAHLDQNLYAPACRARCATARARYSSHQAAGRPHRGRIDCWCNGPAVSDWRWLPADLSQGSIGDRVLHAGGDMAIVLTLFAMGAVIAMIVGNPALAKIRRRPRE